MLTLIISKHSNLRSSKLLPPSNPATRFQAAAISFSLINLVSRPLYRHWPLLAYLSPRTSHSFRVFFALSIFPFFLSLAINSICLKYLARSRIHRGIHDRGRNRISYLFFFIIPFYSLSRGDGLCIRVIALPRPPMIPPPSIHPEGKLVLQAMKFRFDPRFIALSLFCRKPGVRCLGEKKNIYIYIYVCIILDTFRWCFNFPINACLNRASRFGKFIFHAIRADQILFVLHNVRCMLISHLTFRFLLYRN